MPRGLVLLGLVQYCCHRVLQARRRPEVRNLELSLQIETRPATVRVHSMCCPRLQVIIGSFLRDRLLS